MNNIKNNDEVLSFNPFGDDYGDPSDVILKDKIVVSRKEHTCHICAKTIIKAETIRLYTLVFDGSIQSYRFCNECCVAMEKSWEDSGFDLENRYRIRLEILRKS